MNTLEAYENLKKVNFSDEQSREIVKMFVKYYEAEPASKKDLRDTESNLNQDLKNTELRLQKEIEGIKKETQDIRLEIKNVELKLSKEIEGVKLEIQHIKVDFIRWLIGVAIASLGLILTGIRFLR
ncbi:MAG TPA: DUF1640 domain-containing protein [Leptospiraceae bacterium]|nr:DUF1640 domain-containing protein [Leptospiraceae bacterium]